MKLHDAKKIIQQMLKNRFGVEKFQNAQENYLRNNINVNDIESANAESCDENVPETTVVGFIRPPETPRYWFLPGNISYGIVEAASFWW